MAQIGNLGPNPMTGLIISGCAGVTNADAQ